MSNQKKHSVHKKKPRTDGARGGQPDSTLGNLFQSALFGALCGLIAAAILLLAVTAICYATADPVSLTTPLSLAALYLSAFVAGFAAIRRHRAMALACGSLSGLFLMLVFLIISLLFRGRVTQTFSVGASLLVRVLMIPVSAMGGYLGLSRSTHKKRRTRA